MHNLVISFVGRDCPGVVFAVASILEKQNCNIIEASQTILAGEFAAILIVEAPDNINSQDLDQDLAQGLKARGLDFSVISRPALGTSPSTNLRAEPFVITVDGPDKPGLISTISGIFASHSVNIQNLKALLSEDSPRHALFVFEVLIPAGCDMPIMKSELLKEGTRLGQKVSIQHIDIFEAMHRIPPV